MDDYEKKVLEEVQEWKTNMYKKSSLLQRLSKQAQTRMSNLIPEKAHRVISESIKNMVKATILGSNILTTSKPKKNGSLMERDRILNEKIEIYRKTAVVEGAGTGAGGILLGLADFPLLLSIEMKFLFEAAHTYGFDTKDYSERLFILHIFQLAFSSDETRRETMYTIENWEKEKNRLVDMDWRKFQQEYRDYIDLVKVLQLIPGLGAAFGAYANYQLLDRLGETARNCYRMRLLSQ